MDESSFQINKTLLETFSAEEQYLIAKHLELVLAANKNINLTRITSLEEGNLLHIEDSLVAFQEISKAPTGLYADIGTGAGYPGIPLSVVTKRNTLLIDSVQKKVANLKTFIKELGLEDQIDVFAGRIEELALHKPGEFSVITARALSSLPSLLELVSPLLTIKGQFISYKAQIDEDELSAALGLEVKLGMSLLSDRKVLLSDKKTKRRILVFEKNEESSINLPRRIGMAQKKPLKG